MASERKEDLREGLSLHALERGGILLNAAFIATNYSKILVQENFQFFSSDVLKISHTYLFLKKLACNFGKAI